MLCQSASADHSTRPRDILHTIPQCMHVLTAYPNATLRRFINPCPPRFLNGTSQGEPVIACSAFYSYVFVPQCMHAPPCEYSSSCEPGGKVKGPGKHEKYLEQGETFSFMYAVFELPCFAMCSVWVGFARLFNCIILPGKAQG